MDDYFVMYEVAQEWKAATKDLRESVRTAIETALRPAIAKHQSLADLGIVVIYLAAALLWMIL